MPDPSEYESEDDFMKECVPKRIEEGDDQEQAVAACMGIWREKKSMDEIKTGSRHNKTDRARIRDIRRLTNELEPSDVDPELELQSEITEIAIMSMSAVKALGDGRVGGYLVQYGDPETTDLEGDYFTHDTDFDMEFPGKSTVYFNHAVQEPLKSHLSHTATLTTDDFGVWAETILDERNQYEKFLYSLAEAGKIGWSSGTAGHLVQRKSVGAAYEITRWPLGKDASLTHMPAEPRNTVIPLKTLSELLPPIPPLPEITEGVTAPEIVQRDGGDIKQSDLTEVKNMDISEDRLSELLEAAATKAIQALPAEPTKIGVQVTKDEADKPFETLGEQLKAVKDWELTKGASFDPRLKRLEAKVQNELVGSDGGFLVQQDFSNILLTPIHEVGPFSSRARKLPIGNNANSGAINGVDETSRVTGSRWGGVRGYRLAEAVLKTASDFSFRRIEWRLKKYAVVVVSTDELLEDQTQLQQIIQTGCSEELSFMLNDDMFRGDGIGGPLGYLLSPALVTVAKEANQLADTIVAENIIKMYSRMYARSMANAVWFINQDVLPQLFTMAVAVGLGGTPMYMPPGGLSASPYATLLGRPVIVNEFSSTLGDLGDITLADMSEYLWWEKSGIQAASSIHVYFLYDKNAFRFVYRVDGMPSWGNPLTPFKGSNTTSPFIALAARA